MTDSDYQGIYQGIIRFEADDEKSQRMWHHYFRGDEQELYTTAINAKYQKMKISGSYWHEATTSMSELHSTLEKMIFPRFLNVREIEKRLSAYVVLVDEDAPVHGTKK